MTSWKEFVISFKKWRFEIFHRAKASTFTMPTDKPFPYCYSDPLLTIKFCFSVGACVDRRACYFGHLIPGGTIRNVIHWQECAARCKVDFQCQKWSYLEGTQECSMIRVKFVKQVHLIGCVSGSKHCDGDFSESNGNAGNPRIMILWQAKIVLHNFSYPLVYLTLSKS